MTRLEDLSDDQLRATKFAAMQTLCDKNQLPYPHSLSQWLQRVHDTTKEKP